MIALGPQVLPSRALEILKDALAKIQTAQGSSPDVSSLFFEYLKWANASVRMLSPIMSSQDLNRLVTSHRYWVLQTLHAHANGSIHQFISLEIAEGIEDFTTEIEEIEKAERFWKWEKSSYLAVVPDTNFLADHHDHLASIDWHSKMALVDGAPVIICIPMIVVDELDGLKLSNKTEFGKMPIRTRSRLALRTLETHLRNPGEKHLVEPLGNSEAGRIEVFVTLITDPPGHVPLADPDSEIIERALSLKPFASKVYVATSDTGMILRAHQVDLDICKFEETAETKETANKLGT